MLRSEDGYREIESLVPGGPGKFDGRLKTGDRIHCRGTGPGRLRRCSRDAMDKVVEMIRGKKGTHVRLPL